jgi:hypothetical protein
MTQKPKQKTASGKKIDILCPIFHELKSFLRVHENVYGTSTDLV